MGELRINFAQLRQIQNKVREYRCALEEMEGAMTRFEEILKEQAGESITALLEKREELKRDMGYFHENLQTLETLIGNYIEDMTALITPVYEDEMVVVDPEDIRWNLQQIKASIEEVSDIARGAELYPYSHIDTHISKPHITPEMTPEQVSAEWASYDRKCREKRNRQENYRKLEAFCQYNASQAARELEELYDKMEAVYKNRVLEYVEMDEFYGRKADQLYDACTSYREWVWDMNKKARQAMENLWRGALNTAWDGAKGTIGLVYSLGKLQVALQIGAATDVLGITPQWIHQTRKDACETARGMVEILKDPIRVLESLGQSIGDTIDEEGIPYAVGYVAGDIVIGIFLGKGLGKLGKVGKVDDLARIGSSADEIADAAKAAKAVDAVVDSMDEVSDAGRVATNVAEEARKVVEGGSGVVKFNIDEIRPQLKSEPDTAFFWSGKTDGIGGAEVAADIAKGKGGVTLESTIEAKNITMPEWDFSDSSSMDAWDMASAAYAEQVSGEIRAVVGAELRPGNIWKNVELPRLMDNPNVTKITIIDPKTGIETVIFER